jgi:hypothetical protein
LHPFLTKNKITLITKIARGIFIHKQQPLSQEHAAEEFTKNVSTAKPIILDAKLLII